MIFKRVFSAFFVLVLCVPATAFSVETISEYLTEEDVNCTYACTFNAIVVNNDTMQAMVFDPPGSPDVGSVQLLLSQNNSSTPSGTVTMQIRTDSGGKPSGTILADVNRPVSEISWFFPCWFEFDIDPDVTLSGSDKYWIVCKSDVQEPDLVGWHVTPYWPGGNPYEDVNDTKCSEDGGSTWDTIMLSDPGFKVFGTRTTENTTTTITTDPNVVRQGKVAVNITVKDSGGYLVEQGDEPAEVILLATDGSFDDDTVELDNDGTATAWWNAPSSTGTETLTAEYQGHTCGSADYNPSDSNTTIEVLGEDRSTITYLTVVSSDITTNSSVNLTVEVNDVNGNPVSGGNVLFTVSPKAGTFAADSVNVDSGINNNTWHAGPVTGNFTIQASYQGGQHTSLPIIYGASDTNDTFFVDYTDVNTVTTFYIDPNWPYISHSTYVIVEVKEKNTNAPVPDGGIVELTAEPISTTFPGDFREDSLTLKNGRAYTFWTAPDGAGLVKMTAAYQPDGPHLHGGERFLSSQSNDLTVPVRVDNDNHGTGLSWMTEWNTDYTFPRSNLSHTPKICRDFTATLTGWTGQEFSNSGAWEDHMKGTEFGQENDFMDSHDLTLFAGHGNKDHLIFDTLHDNIWLNHNDTYGSWGDKDAEWALFFACLTMSKSGDWAKAMDGLHLITGFVTKGREHEDFGQILGGFLKKQHLWDRPHSIAQAWFLAGDFTQKTNTKMRVIAESPETMEDHIWSQGFVAFDPYVDNDFNSISHDYNEPNGISADPGAPTQYAVVGEPFQLDGSGTSGLSVDEYLFFVWDMNTWTNTDDGDWDCRDGDTAFDDADAWGRRAVWVFDQPGSYEINLIVINDDWRTANDTATVIVSLPGGSPPMSPPPAAAAGGGAIEIIDNTTSLPTEMFMATFALSGYSGYDNVVNIANSMVGNIPALKEDELGNYSGYNGDKEVIVNKHTGAAMYLNTAKAYIKPDTLPSQLPANPRIIADGYLAAHSISPQGGTLVFDRVMDIYAESGQKGERKFTSKTPFQRCVHYRRQMNSMEQFYPVVGPGGKVSVLMDGSGDVIMFTKICRDMQFEGEEEISYRPAQAIIAFQNLGPDVLIGGSILPPGCTRIDINNIRLGYYEKSFVTPQRLMLPVYILDVICEDDKGAVAMQLYMSAMTSPLQIGINSPGPQTTVIYDQSVNFIGTVFGGKLPYSYEWRSDVDGVLSTSSSFSTSLLSVYCRSQCCSCEPLWHTISFKVTDSYGYENTAYVKVKVLGSCSDFDRNGTVDMEDYAKFALDWLSQLGNENYEHRVDFNKDSIIDYCDLCVLSEEWLQSE